MNKSKARRLKRTEDSSTVMDETERSHGDRRDSAAVPSELRTERLRPLRRRPAQQH
jgi:hypothetical protein